MGIMLIKKEALLGGKLKLLNTITTRLLLKKMKKSSPLAGS